MPSVKQTWPRVTLAEHVDIISGFPFKSAKFTTDLSDVCLVKGENLHHEFVDWASAKRWPIAELKEYSKFQLEPDDVVVAMDRPWIERGLKYSWIRKHDPNCLLVQRVSRLRGANGLLTNYLRYIIASPQFTDYIKPIVTGVSVPHISGKQITDFKFALPPVEIQSEIVSIISAYDDLIENNTRRIKILEEMAQAIYREWFVEFRAPGIELRKASEEERILTGKGVFPDSWGVRTLGDVTLNFDSKRKPISSMKRAHIQGEYPYYGAAKIVDKVNDYIFDGLYLLMAEDGSVITSSGKPMLQLVNCKFWANNHTHVIQGKGAVSTEFLYLRLNDLDVIGYITGAAQPKITQENLNRIPVIIADETLQKRFNALIATQIKLIHTLQRVNSNLRYTRDLLLPKLICGEIEVGEDVAA